MEFHQLCWVGVVSSNSWDPSITLHKVHQNDFEWRYGLVYHLSRGLRVSFKLSSISSFYYVLTEKQKFLESRNLNYVIIHRKKMISTKLPCW